MTSLEREQLLPTTPEVSFEIVIALACSWSIVLYLYSCFLCAIDRYRRRCCVIIPVSFPRYRSHGYEATKLNNGSRIASFPGSHAPEREIEVVQAWRAWYFFVT